MDLVILTISFIVLFILGLEALYSSTRTKRCPKCGETMVIKTMIGDGDGPAPEHIIWSCTFCNYEEEELI